MRYRIISDSMNQLCNRFFSYLDSISWAIRENKHVYILFWNENIKDFDLLRDNNYVSFPFYFVEKSPLLKKIYSRTIDSVWANKFYCSRIGRFLGFISGWPMRGETKNLLDDKEVLRKIFLPNKPIVQTINQLFVKYRQQYDIIIGIHIRRGDYATFMNGKYMYNFTDYEQKMYEIKQLHKNKRTCFYIASNEKVPSTIIKREDVVHIDLANTATDLYGLSQCDKIIGPPSTFSRWASYLYDVPLYFIFDINRIIDSEDLFSPIIDHYHFANGQEIPF